MIQNLGIDEAQSILSEREDIDVSCDFCGANYKFDAVDTAQLFNSQDPQPPAPSVLQWARYLTETLGNLFLLN